MFVNIGVNVLQIKPIDRRTNMKYQLCLLILVSIFITKLLIKDAKGQTFVKGKGEGNVRITKTCGAGRKKSAAEIAEMQRRMKEKEKALLKKKYPTNNVKIKPILHNILFNGQATCPKLSFPKFIEKYF